jgi:hypothetical protein
VAGRAAQISAHMGGPPSRGIKKYQAQGPNGLGVRASTGSSPDQVPSYLGIEKADIAAKHAWTHGRIDLPSKRDGAGLRSRASVARGVAREDDQPDPR